MGALYLCEHTLPEHGIKPDLVILGEQSDGNLNVGQRGKVELVADVYGKVAHSSAPWQGISAVEKARPVMDAIINMMYKQHAAWRTDLNDPLVVKAFESLRAIGLDPKEEYFVVRINGYIKQSS